MKSLYLVTTKKLLKNLLFVNSQKVRYASMEIDIVIIGFSPNEVKRHRQKCDNSIVTFGIRRFCLRFSNTSHVESLDGFRK